MKDALATGALPIYAKMLADACDVEVVIGTQTRAYTTGRTIYLPPLPGDSALAQKLAYGMIMHEAGHIEETQFNQFQQDKVLQSMAGRLEDVRMEAKQIRKFPGGKRRLAAMVEGLVETGYFAPLPADCTANQAMAAYILTRLRADLLGQKACEEIAHGAEARCKELLPESALTRLRVLMYQVANCRDTADVVVLAAEIVKMLQEEAQKNPPPNGAPDAGDDSTDGDDDQNVGDDSTDGDDDQNVGDDSTNGDDDQNADDDSVDGDDDQSAGDDSTGGDGHGGSEKIENLRKILSGEDDDGVVDIGDMVKAVINAQAAPYADTAVSMPVHAKPVGVPSQASTALDTVRLHTRALKRKLYNLLEAEAESTVLYGRRGRLSSRRIARVATGDARVFERIEIGVTLDTAVMVLLDRSGSMSSNIDKASACTLALASALDGLHGVESAAAAFPHYVSGSSDVLLLKDFDEPMREVAGRFLNVGVCGCTPMAEALMWCGYQLLSRPEERKILFVVTDGDPDVIARADYVLKALRAAEVETLALGIGAATQTLPQLFPVHRIIGSVEQMSRAVFDMMSKQLLREAA
ncbi:MAG: cobaltochelatase CobT [Azoarcus sp.]|nr:cobaltochelatase CobT [Azoarcus sp.]